MLDDVFDNWFTVGSDAQPNFFIDLLALFIWSAVALLILVVARYVIKKYTKVKDRPDVWLPIFTIVPLCFFFYAVLSDVNGMDEDTDELAEVVASEEVFVGCEELTSEIILERPDSKYNFTEQDKLDYVRSKAAKESFYFLGMYRDSGKEFTISGVNEILGGEFLIFDVSNRYHLDCYRVLKNGDVDNEFTQAVEEAYLIGGDLPYRAGM